MRGHDRRSYMDSQTKLWTHVMLSPEQEGTGRKYQQTGKERLMGAFELPPALSNCKDKQSSAHSHYLLHANS